jgi:hypothetical protein
MNLLNQKAVREFALAAASQYRGAVGFERVSKDFLIRIEADLKSKIIAAVKAQPSLGKTIK